MHRCCKIMLLLLSQIPSLRAQTSAPGLAEVAAVNRPVGVEIRTDVMVPMRDGVRLATDVYLPVWGDGMHRESLPTVLVRTPYGKARCSNNARYFVGHGYAAVCQDTRGRYNSEGVWWWLGNDGPDGYDTIEWIAVQSWSDGKIGMLGGSYEGGTQHAAAMERPPHLTTVIPADAVANMGYQSMRNAGAFELRFWNWIYMYGLEGSRQARDITTAAMFRELNANRLAYLPHLPLRRGTTPLRHASEYEEWLIEAMRHGANDEFWAQNNILDDTQRYKDMPVYLVGGWYDSWAGNTTASYVALNRALGAPVYLIMGPWTHGGWNSSAHGQVSFGPEAAMPDVRAWWLEWFDRWLKGRDNGVGNEAPFRTPVRIFVMGTGDERKDRNGHKDHGGYWRDEREWPLARTRYTSLYFVEGGKLTSAPPSAGEGATTFVFDPNDPVPTIGGNTSSEAGLMLRGAWDQKGGEHVWNWPEPIPLSARNDVVVFQTEPLAEDVEVTGEIVVRL